MTQCKRCDLLFVLYGDLQDTLRSIDRVKSEYRTECKQQGDGYPSKISTRAKNVIRNHTGARTYSMFIDWLAEQGPLAREQAFIHSRNCGDKTLKEIQSLIYSKSCRNLVLRKLNKQGS